MRYENGPELKVVTHFDRTEALKVRPCDAFFCIALVSGIALWSDLGLPSSSSIFPGGHVRRLHQDFCKMADCTMIAKMTFVPLMRWSRSTFDEGCENGIRICGAVSSC